MTENKRLIKSDLGKVREHVIQPHEYDESPEWTEEDFERAEFRIGDKLIRRGRPPLENPKRHVNLRLDADLVKHFKRKGKGWQTRINATLRKAVRLKAPKRKRA
jgi:uncharacterized protein (DUF4415 family)